MANFTATNQIVSNSYYVVSDTTPILLNFTLTDGYENLEIQIFQVFDEGLPTVKYYMRARDPDCVPVTYRFWLVSDEPDTTAAQYSGTRCGVNPLTDVVVQKIINLC